MSYTQRLEQLFHAEMQKGKRWVPARLQTAMALLESLRNNPSLRLVDHLSSEGSAGIRSHEKLGKEALKRFGLDRLNKTHGRRSSHLPKWGPKLLELLRDEGFVVAGKDKRVGMIEEAQNILVARLRMILDAEPLVVSVRGNSAESVIRDVLQLADEKGKAGDVAQYLVGAKLAMRFSLDIPVQPANKADRKSVSDRDRKLGDFEISDAVIEVALGFPDEKHIDQVLDALESHNVEVWLLTRCDRVNIWKEQLKESQGVALRRVVVRSVDAFVGQNVSELGEFSAEGREERLKTLFDIYNSRWVAIVGTPGIRIEVRGRSRRTRQ